MLKFSTLFGFITKYSLIIGIIWAGLWFFVFYPATHVSIDELEYQTNAQRLLEGTLQQDCDAKVPGQFDTGKGYCIGKYNIGTSLFLLPTAYNFQLTAIPIFLMFVVGSFGFYSLIKLMNWPKWLALLYTCYPVFIYFSRTRYSEMISAVLITWLLYWGIKLYKEKLSLLEQVLLGCSIGLAVLTRYTNILPIGVFGLVLALDLIRKNQHNYFATIRSILPTLATLVPWIAVFMLFNSWLYGGLLRSGYYYSGEEGLYVASQVPQMLLLFGLALLILYPGMLLGIFVSKFPLKIPILAAVLTTTLFYAGFPFNFFEGRLFDLIFAIRFLVPITPFLLFGYAGWLVKMYTKFQKNKIAMGVLISIILAAFVSVPAINLLHTQFLANVTVVTGE